jgi:uncharacterized protein YbcI
MGCVNRSRVREPLFGFLAPPSSRCAVFFSEGSEIRRTGMTSPNGTLKGGALNAAISNAVVRLLGEYVGRGPTKARTIHSGKLVLCVLEDTMTRAERSLAAGGREEFVLRLRHAIQNTMQEDLTAAVEALTHRKVAAFLSANHVEPDLAAEVFVLDEPLHEAVEVSAPLDGSRRTEPSQDRSSQTEGSQSELDPTVSTR